MAQSAKDAVFVKSDELRGDEQVVRGPSEFSPEVLDAVVQQLGSVGFQATNFGKAVNIVNSMLSVRRSMQETAAGWTDETENPPVMKLYLGLTANLLGTGVREAVLFLVKHKLVDQLVITGGGVEHDIRRAVSPSSYVVDEYPSFAFSGAGTRSATVPSHRWSGHFGNVSYDKDDAAYVSVMTAIFREMVEEQQREKQRRTAGGVPDSYYDLCSWSWGPSRIWKEVGLRLTRFVSEDVAKSSVVYWAARNDIPIFSPSFTDGDVMRIVDSVSDISTGCRLFVDLVEDIHLINKSAMGATKTGMIILGGGVAKHHVCNANLMRNGADFSVFINNAQEFDGSDAGARPDEAVSWGKIRLDGESVKVYSEISLAFPLLVAQTFVPYVREHVR